MPRYTVDVKAFISVGVEADTEEKAREIADCWVDWLSPTDEQIAEYQTDHPGLLEGGVFGVDGDSEVDCEDD